MVVENETNLWQTNGGSGTNFKIYLLKENFVKFVEPPQCVLEYIAVDSYKVGKRISAMIL